MNDDGSRDRRLQRVAAGSLAVGLAALAYIIYNSLPCFFDDAYMFIRYAQNILAGYGHAWNPGEGPAFGSTSVTHLAVVTLMKLCLPGLPDAQLLLAASAIPTFVLLVVLVIGCGRLAEHPLLRGNYVLWGGLLVPAIVLQEPLKYHLRSGMDTMLSALSNAVLILLTLWLVRRLRGGEIGDWGLGIGKEGGTKTDHSTPIPNPQSRIPSSRAPYGLLAAVVAAAYFTYLTRPDNGIYATLFPAMCILLLGSGPRRKMLAAFALSMLAVLALDLLAKRLLLGTALPLPFYAKQHGAYEGYAGVSIWNPIVLMRIFFWGMMPFLCVIVFLFQRRNAAMLAAFFVPVGLTFAYYFTVNQIMGFEARFYYPSLPFFAVAAAVTLDRWLVARQGRALLSPSELVVRLIVLFLVIFGGRQLTFSTYLWYDRLMAEELAGPSSRQYETIAAEELPPPRFLDALSDLAWIAKNSPPRTKIALSEYGQIGAAAPEAVLVDVVGLHDKEFALEGFSAERLFARKPDLIWFPHYHYTKMIRDVLDSDEFWEEYLYYPRAFIFGLAIRKDSPHFEEISALVKDRWELNYEGLRMEDYLARPLP